MRCLQVLYLKDGRKICLLLKSWIIWLSTWIQSRNWAFQVPQGGTARVGIEKRLPCQIEEVGWHLWVWRLSRRSDSGSIRAWFKEANESTQVTRGSGLNIIDGCRKGVCCWIVRNRDHCITWRKCDRGEKNGSNLSRLLSFWKVNH